MPAIIFKDSSYKQLKKLNKVEKNKVSKKLLALASDPYAGKALQGGYKGLYSLRAWPYRIIYEISKDSIVVFSIAHRQGSYKK